MGLFSKNDQHTRLTVLETVFSDSQKAMVTHMEHEDAAYKRLHNDMKNLIDKIDDLAKSNNSNNAQTKTEICNKVDEKYLTKLAYQEASERKVKALEKQISDDKELMYKTIEKSQEQTFKRLAGLGTIAIILITGFAWIFKEVLSNGHFQ